MGGEEETGRAALSFTAVLFYGSFIFISIRGVKSLNLFDDNLDSLCLNFLQVRKELAKQLARSCVTKALRSIAWLKTS